VGHARLRVRGRFSIASLKEPVLGLLDGFGLAPISSTPYFSSVPSRVQRGVQRRLAAQVGSRASGRSLMMILATIRG
jgi:hypothetical protein